MEKMIRILCLADKCNVESIQSILKTAGFSADVRWIGLRDEFESAMRGGGYDLILTNYQLQDYDGFAALKWTREMGLDTPFIFVSEPPGEEIVIRALAEGAAGYVLENGMDRLPQVVRRALNEVQEKRSQHKSDEDMGFGEASIRHMLEYSQDVVYQRNLQMDRYDYISSTIFDISGYTSNEIVSLPFGAILEMIHPDDQLAIKKMLADAEKNAGTPCQMDFRFRHRDGTYRWFQDNVRVNVDSNKVPLYRVGVIRDITEQKMAAESLHASEERYHSIITAMSEGVVFHRADGTIVSANPGAERVLGMTFDQMIGRTSMDPRWQSIHEDGSPFPGENHPAMVTLRTGVPQRNVIMGVHKPDGSLSWISINSELVITPGAEAPSGVVATFTDITQHKAAEDALRVSEERYRTLIEQAADGIFIADSNGRYLDANPSGCRMLGYTKEELLKLSMHELVSDVERSELEKTMSMSWNGVPYIVERQLKTKNGVLLSVEISGKRMENGNFLGVVRDVSERKRAEEAIHYQANLLANVMDAVIATDLEYKITSWNAAAKRLYGWEEVEVLGKTMAEIATPEYPYEERAEIIKDIASKGAWSGEAIHTRRSGQKFPIQALVSAVKDLSGNLIGYVAVNRDITERKEAERELRESEDKFKYIFDYSVVGNSITSLSGEINPNLSLCEMLGYTREEIQNRNWREFTHPDDIDMNDREVMAVLAGEKASTRFTKRFIQKNGSIVWAVLSTTLRRDEQGQPLYFITSVSDITELKRAEEQTRIQIERLTALKNIDLAITSSFDLRLSLDTVLAQVINQLGVDAADIFIFNQPLNILKCEAAYGFRRTRVVNSQLPLSNGHVGRVVVERQPEYLPDIRQTAQPFTRADMIRNEGFEAYFAVPLSTKGKVKGVLELFHRKPKYPDTDWLNFLEAISAQAAIAIDDVQLFENLENSNLELSLAYDATIEGWSRAMDLRDKETEGHTLRVTDMTLKLAAHFGLVNEEIKHIRWGALLHDIGKIGVPDGILHKAAPLGQEEWKVIRQHPVFAHEMLAPIHYLRKALAIPYCHHEKWDGSGYPRGLRGDQIPLEARIFAVVDVWDALTSDRPYRPAWSPERTLEYIQKESGHHFDPEVVKAFLDFLSMESKNT